MKFTNFFKRGPSGNINLHPENAEPYSYYKAIEVSRECRYYRPKLRLFKKKYEVIFRYGYTNNFMKTGEPGIIVHGSPNGRLKFFDGIEPHRTAGDYNSKKKSLTPLEFYHHLIYRLQIDLARDKRPLHLISCYSGQALNHREMSVAQQLSNIMQRPIWSYGLHEVVTYNCRLRGLYDIIHGVGEFIDNNQVKIKPKMIRPNWHGVI
ncbi:hypothetical protein ACSMDK_09355 [Yersinia enterocolitica]|uniref:hypothetical protein n=1 Tax=Yersinia TaxID=629 RepID=UPI003AB7E424